MKMKPIEFAVWHLQEKFWEVLILIVIIIVPGIVIELVKRFMDV